MLWISASIALLGVLIFYFYWLRNEEGLEAEPAETQDYELDMEASDELSPTEKETIEVLQGEKIKKQRQDYAMDASDEITPSIEVLHHDKK
ncbi:hypothetical protein JCM16358_20230 [Halanaerocella petrolearia]